MVKIIFNCHDEVGEPVSREIITFVGLMENTCGLGHMIFTCPRPHDFHLSHGMTFLSMCNIYINNCIFFILMEEFTLNIYKVHGENNKGK